jgi:hypothetical protein
VENMLHAGAQTQGSQTIFEFGDQGPILGSDFIA